MIKSFKVCAEQHGRVTDGKYLLVLRTRVKQINFFLRNLTIRLCLRSVEQIGSNISINMLLLSEIFGYTCNNNFPLSNR